MNEDLGCCKEAQWTERGTCSYCGSARPSEVLRLIEAGAKVTPTDKSYKIYVVGASGPASKCYLDHFGEQQAVDFVQLLESGKMNLAFPGRFYAGLAFAKYREAFEKAGLIGPQ